MPPIGEGGVCAWSSAIGLPAGSERQRLEARQLITSTQSQPRGIHVQAIIGSSPQRIFDLLTDYDSLPKHIYGLEEAQLLRRNEGVASVCFAMKLPFPVGRLSWTNVITTHQESGVHSIEWVLVDGDLRMNDGKLLMTPYRGDPSQTYARYQVSVESRSKLPKSAERFASRWLVPKIVGKLRDIAEKG